MINNESDKTQDNEDNLSTTLGVGNTLYDGDSNYDDRMKKMQENFIGNISEGLKTYSKLEEQIENIEYKSRQDVFKSIFEYAIKENTLTENLNENPQIPEFTEDIAKKIEHSKDSKPRIYYKKISNSENKKASDEFQLIVVMPGSNKANSSVICYNTSEVDNISYDSLRELNYNEGTYTFNNLNQLSEYSDTINEASDSVAESDYYKYQFDVNNNFIYEESTFKRKAGNLLKRFVFKRPLKTYTNQYLDWLLFNGLISSLDYKKLSREGSVNISQTNDELNSNQENIPQETVTLLKNIENYVNDLNTKYDKAREALVNKVDEQIDTTATSNDTEITQQQEPLDSNSEVYETDSNLPIQQDTTVPTEPFIDPTPTLIMDENLQPTNIDTSGNDLNSVKLSLEEGLEKLGNTNLVEPPKEIDTTQIIEPNIEPIEDNSQEKPIDSSNVPPQRIIQDDENIIRSPKSPIYRDVLPNNEPSDIGTTNKSKKKSLFNFFSGIFGKK